MDIFLEPVGTTDITMGPMNAETQNSLKFVRDAWVAAGGALTGFAALIGASCCVLPIVLVNLGFSAALVSNLGFFVRAKPYFMALTVVLIVIGFVVAFWNGRRPGSRAIVLLSAASILALGAYIMPYYERELLQWIR